MNHKDAALLVVSTDSYADVWGPFFQLFWKYWPDCPFPVYLGANKKSVDDPRIKMILTGEDSSWATNLLRMCQAIEAKYVLLLLEDFFFFHPVDTAQILNLFDVMVSQNGAYLRLSPTPRPNSVVSGEPEIGLIAKGVKIRSSLRASFWKRDVLMSLLNPGETAWQMEREGSIRSEKLDEKFFSVWNPTLSYKNAIIRGEWDQATMRKLEKEGIFPDLEKRPMMPRRILFRRTVVNFLRPLSEKLPVRVGRPIGDLLRKMGVLAPRRD